MSENGIWNQWQADEYHQSSPKLANWLSNYLPKDKPVYDFGCGIGYYVAYLEKLGFDAWGLEGYELNNFLTKNIFIHDLTQPLTVEIFKTITLPTIKKVISGERIVYMGIQKGSAVSFEVAEHLPPPATEQFIQTLIQSCDKHLILSWAEIGQAGVGHINCRSQEDVISDIESRGFKLNKEATADARNNIDKNCNWFRRTLLVFERT